MFFVVFFKGNKISPWVCVRVCSVIKLSPVSFPIHPGKYQKRLGKGRGTYLCLERARGWEYGGWGWGYRAGAPKSARALSQCRGPRDPLCSRLLLGAKIRPKKLKTKHSLQQLASDGLTRKRKLPKGIPEQRVTKQECHSDVWQSGAVEEAAVGSSGVGMRPSAWLSVWYVADLSRACSSYQSYEVGALATLSLCVRKPRKSLQHWRGQVYTVK